MITDKGLVDVWGPPKRQAWGLVIKARLYCSCSIETLGKLNGWLAGWLAAQATLGGNPAYLGRVLTGTEV